MSGHERLLCGNGQICIDQNGARISALRLGGMPFFELEFSENVFVIYRDEQLGFAGSHAETIADAPG